MVKKGTMKNGGSFERGIPSGVKVFKANKVMRESPNEWIWARII